MKQDVFENLRKLQGILSEKFEIEKEINEIPKAMITKKELLNRLKKTYIEKNEKVENTKSKIAKLRIKLAETESLREQYERQMDEIKTQREYEILDKEIKDATVNEQESRKEIIRFEKDLEEYQILLEKDERLIKQQEEDIQIEEEKNKNESDSKHALVKKLEQEEKEIAPDMDEEILFKFKRIIKSKAGVGIVPVKNAVCTGCHMILPAQFVNEVRSGEDILFCPYCSRILFFEELESDDTYDTTFLSDDDNGGLLDADDDDDF